MQTVKQILDYIETDRSKLDTFPTGFTGLDHDIDGGFMRRELVIIGGFTGIGKSYISGQIMFNIARAGNRTAYISLEITNTMVLSRLIGQEADVKSIKIVTGSLTEAEKQRKDRATGKIYGYEYFMHFYDDVYALDAIKNVIVSGGYDVVFIDFIQNVSVPRMDEYQRLSYAALELQKLAKKQNCCIVILSQLSNESAKQTGGNLEYKGSGSIATVCDLGFILTRDDLASLRLTLKKNRRGVSGQTWPLFFQGEGGKLG